MSLKEKNKATKAKSHKKSNAVVSDSVGSYEKHPFFIKKALAAKEFLLKVGLPKQLSKRAHA